MAMTMGHGGPGRTEIRPFEASDIDEAAELLAARHRRHRAMSPGLDPAFETLPRARAELERLAADGGASGAIAVRGGQLLGYLLGVEEDRSIWGSNAWVPSAGHAAAEPAIVGELYRSAASGWVGAGRDRHYIVVPSGDPDLVDAWFRVGFGQQHAHALREAPDTSFRARQPVGLTVRRAERGDIPELAVLDRVLPEHQARSPVFSRVPVPDLAEVRAEIDAGFDDPRFTTFVAVRNGRVVGSATGCSIEASSINTGLIRPAKAGLLGYAAVLPEARGLGAGRALGEAVRAWARDAGCAWVGVDWRVTNLEANRTWPRLGFQLTFLRLHRAIV
jgi:GNAT superfamily N-acetyltransferase